MFAKTAFSISHDETRQHLAGVLFESDGKTARMVSTDGHRLSKVGRELPGGPVLEKGVLIPRKGVGEIRRVLEGRESQLRDWRLPGALRPARQRCTTRPSTTSR